MKKIEKKNFEKKLKFWNPYGLRVSHIKFQQNQRQKFFFVSKGGPFGVFPIFDVLIHRQWSTLTDRNGGSDYFECWNRGTKRCLNIKNLMWEQVLDVCTTFHWIVRLKSRAGQKDPPPCDNVIPKPMWNRVKRLWQS